MAGQPPTPLIEAHRHRPRLVFPSRRVGGSRPQPILSAPSRTAERVQSGNPDWRPASGSCVLSRTPGMVALAEEFNDNALMATMLGTHPIVLPTDLLSAFRSCFGIRRIVVNIEVCALPFDFFVRFTHSSDGKCVLHSSHSFECYGDKMSFLHWHHACGWDDRLGKLCFFSKLSFDGLRLHAWEPEALKQVVSRLGGELVEIVPLSDRWIIEVKAWLKDLDIVPKMYNVDIPSRPRRHLCWKHPLIIHLQEVLDPIHGIQDPDEAARKHPRRLQYWLGRIDGTGPPPFRDGAHGFGGGIGRGQAGGSDFPRVKTEV
uniref:Uncharacterized protein n=1 Tax=Avena sativa TaxID=4498 RepID=A0ACD5YCR8_AVESA